MHAGMVNLNHLSGKEHASDQACGQEGRGGRDSLPPSRSLSFMSHGTLLHAFDGP